MYDLISIGDTTVDTFLTVDEATVLCDIHKEHCRLCLSYADKIPVEKITRVYAVGNAANSAIGAARLGLKSALYTILGADDNGLECYRRLRMEKVAKAYIQIHKKQATNYSTVINFKTERTILVYHEPRVYQLPALHDAQWVYLTSMGKGGEKILDDVRGFIKRSGARLAFNPGTFQMKLGLGRLLRLLARTHILFLNKEEAERLLGRDDDMRSLLGAFQRKGPRIVVITDGSNGSYAYDGTTMYALPLLKSKVVERTGAGDSYATAFVAALARGFDVPTAMRWGTINAASVVGYVGAQEGLLTKEEMARRLKKHAKFVAKKLS